MIKIRNKTGAPVKKDDFFDRIAEQADLWRKIKDQNHLLMLAPRRVGKTSLMYKLQQDAKAQGFNAVMLSFADCRDEMDCVQNIYSAFVKQSSLWSRLQQGLKQRAGWLEQIDIMGSKLKFKTLQREQWREAGEPLINALEQSEQKWLILVDELPIFIIKRIRQQKDSEAIEAFLYWLRDIRQNHPNIHWMFAGSIGLDTIVARYNMGDSINDLTLVSLDAFSNETAEEFLQLLGNSYNTPLSPAVCQRIIKGLGWAIPYYLQIVFQLLRDHPQPIENQHIDQVFETLLSARYKQYFDYWRQRLQEELEKPDDAHARRLLSHICQSPQGSDLNSLKEVLANQLSANNIDDVDQRDNQLRFLLDLLVNDGYLLENKQQYCFRFELLRRYWQQRVAA